jgi:hypothetical protein
MALLHCFILQMWNGCQTPLLVTNTRDQCGLLINQFLGATDKDSYVRTLLEDLSHGYLQASALVPLLWQDVHAVDFGRSEKSSYAAVV